MLNVFAGMRERERERVHHLNMHLITLVLFQRTPLCPHQPSSTSTSSNVGGGEGAGWGTLVLRRGRPKRLLAALYLYMQKCRTLL